MEENHNRKKKALIADIFGDDSDEDSEQENKYNKKPLTKEIRLDDSDEDDNLFNDDKDQIGKTLGTAAFNQDNLLDSDDEDIDKDYNAQVPAKSSMRMKRSKGPRLHNKTEKISKKRKIDKKAMKNQVVSNNMESGDEYDSGEEVKETEDDRAFIADNDDYYDIVKEYDEDNTQFNDYDDEGGEYYKKDGKYKKSKKSNSNKSEAHGGINLKDLDPVSQTLASMKNPKAQTMSEIEKVAFVEKLQRKMAEAVELDDKMFSEQKPAIYKIQLLEMVQTAILMRPLQNTLLDHDILSSLRDWIEPRDANTLPALSVRAAVYELLLQLPCLPDHLKRVTGNRPPIGAIIVALRRHKMETAANKRLLKEIMDKWSRPIFSKNADVRITGGVGLLSSDHPEVQEAILLRYNKDNENNNQNTVNELINKSQKVTNVGFDEILSKQDNNNSKTINSQFSRARTPYNTGFLFTVQPELKSIDKRNMMERSLGEDRMRLFKKITETTRGKNSGLGKKSNPRYATSYIIR